MARGQEQAEELAEAVEGWPGWRIVEASRHEHGWKLYPADPGHRPIMLHRRYGGANRGWRNILARLRRAGAPIELRDWT